MEVIFFIFLPPKNILKNYELGNYNFGHIKSYSKFCQTLGILSSSANVASPSSPTRLGDFQLFNRLQDWESHHPNSDLENESPFPFCHCEHLTMNHVRFMISPELKIVRERCVPARRSACFRRNVLCGQRYGTQAWQSHWERRDCFVSPSGPEAL